MMLVTFGVSPLPFYLDLSARCSIFAGASSFRRGHIRSASYRVGTSGLLLDQIHGELHRIGVRFRLDLVEVRLRLRSSSA